MTDAELVAAIEIHFGGRDRAEHIVTCERCGHDEQGDFHACPRCPGVRRTLTLRSRVGAHR